MQVKDANILITGGSTGIGYATAKILKDKGANILIVSSNPERLKKASQQLSIPYFICDVSCESQVQSMIDYAIETLGGIDVLINNAGFGKFASLINTELQDFERQWQVNTKGVFLVGRAVARLLVKKQSGCIINVGSTAANRGFAHGSAYASSKFAVSALTQCWRAELRSHNIRVMQVNPSEVVTQFKERAGILTTEQCSDYKLQPDHIAHTILNLLSFDDVGFVPDLEVWATNPDRS